jgi:hypothetical protein
VSLKTHEDIDRYFESLWQCTRLRF